MADLKPLVDGDILLYEIGFGSERGWQAIVNDADAIPPWSYVEEMLSQRLRNIQAVLDTKQQCKLFITEGQTFRYDIAKTKPYKGTRKDSKPWHFNNLKVYMKHCLDATVVTHLEADDMMAIESTASNGTAVICSRDKDLKQVPGYFYAWELGNQPQFGPLLIDKAGGLSFDSNKNKLTGTGLAWFYAQVLTGDIVDNIPGLKGCGPVAAYKLLSGGPDGIGHDTYLSMQEAVSEAYKAAYGDRAEEVLLEQGQLCWIVRRFNKDGSPEVWHPGLIS